MIEVLGKEGTSKDRITGQYVLRVDDSLRIINVTEESDYVVVRLPFQMQVAIGKMSRDLTIRIDTFATHAVISENLALAETIAQHLMKKGLL